MYVKKINQQLLLKFEHQSGSNAAVKKLQKSLWITKSHSELMRFRGTCSQGHKKRSTKHAWCFLLHKKHCPKAAEYQRKGYVASSATLWKETREHTMTNDLASTECANTLNWIPSTKLSALWIHRMYERRSLRNLHPKLNALSLIYLNKNPNKRHKGRFHSHLDSFIQKKVSSTAFHLWIHKRKKHTSFLSTLRKLRAKWLEACMSRVNQKVSVPKHSFLYPKISPTAFFWGWGGERFSYIYWFSSSSFREYSQMCKATSNSNISWSKKWNLHLTAFFNNVQSPFNRKMEQSANRKRKGLIKTHQS